MDTITNIQHFKTITEALILLNNQLPNDITYKKVSIDQYLNIHNNLMLEYTSLISQVKTNKINMDLINNIKTKILILNKILKEQNIEVALNLLQ